MATVLTPKLEGTPGQPPSYNVGMAETFSWVPVENDAGRPLFARAGYITNFQDFTVSISAAELNITSIEIKDGNSNRVADVEFVGGYNALSVFTQDLESTSDSVALGDIYGNKVGIDETLSALNVFVTNPTTSLNVTNTVAVTGLVTINNPVSNVGTANASDWNIIPVIAPSGSFNPLPSFLCSLVTVFNSTSATINVKRTGNSFALPLYKNSSIDITVVSNANEISVSSSTVDELTASALVTKF